MVEEDYGRTGKVLGQGVRLLPQRESHVQQVSKWGLRHARRRGSLNTVILSV